jgi:antitoxin ParD1/3/4
VHNLHFLHIMRTNIDIDDDLMAKAMAAGPFNTKKDAVDAGLRLLARQADYREILKWQGKLKWQGDPAVDWTQPDPADAADAANPGSPTAAPPPQRPSAWGDPLPATRLHVADSAGAKPQPQQAPTVSKRRAGR